METVADAFRANERLLWGLGYRMTGLASDADEIVQETFLRALEHPLPDDGRPMRPWLVRVCANLARDRLRTRRRRGGEVRTANRVWLPSPVPSERFLPVDEGDAEALYHRTETAGLAFLLALEALTPNQRAVLLLRDVFELEADEVAAALGTTPGAVRVTHHRARRALDEHAAPAAAPGDATLVALSTFLGALATGDAAAALAALAPDVVLRTDGGGVYFAAKVPVCGAEKVLRFLLHIAGFSPAASAPTPSANNTPTPLDARWEIRSLNGEPMVVIELGAPTQSQAPRFVVGVSLGATGHIVAIHWVLDPAKLLHVAPITDVGAAPGTTGQTAPLPR